MTIDKRCTCPNCMKPFTVTVELDNEANVIAQTPINCPACGTATLVVCNMEAALSLDYWIFIPKQLRGVCTQTELVNTGGHVMIQYAKYELEDGRVVFISVGEEMALVSTECPWPDYTSDEEYYGEILETYLADTPRENSSKSSQYNNLVRQVVYDWCLYGNRGRTIAYTDIWEVWYGR